MNVSSPLGLSRTSMTDALSRGSGMPLVLSSQECAAPRPARAPSRETRSFARVLRSTARDQGRARNTPFRIRPFHQLQRLARFDAALSQHAQIPTVPTSLADAPHQLRPLPSASDVPTRLPRLRDLQPGLADRIDVTQTDVGLVEKRHREVFRKSAIRQFRELELSPPVRIVARPVRKHGLVWPTVQLAIGLAIADEVRSTEPDWTRDRDFQYPGSPRPSMASLRPGSERGPPGMPTWTETRRARGALLIARVYGACDAHPRCR